jgi:four helix bundle protein
LDFESRKTRLKDFGLGKTMDEQLFKTRTKTLALRVIQFVEELPHNQTATVISRQLPRSATSIGANYRVACRGKSTADVISKLAIVEEEADESVYWLELLIEANIVPEDRVSELLKEANEILAMTVASIKTLRMRL